MTDVTVLGLGLMGQALAKALVTGGLGVTVWNRTPGRAADLNDVNESATAASAAAASDLVVVCVLDYAVVTEILDKVDVSGRTIVNLTNGTPRQARETAARVEKAGGVYVDGGIMAIPPMIGQPAATVLYSGDADAYDRHATTLSLLGRSRFLGTDPGEAALVDLALLSAMYGMFGGVWHAFALTAKANLPRQEFAGMLVEWLTATHAMVSRPPDAEVVASAEMQLAVYPNLFDASRDEGVRLDFVRPMYEMMKEEVATGRPIAELLRNADEQT
ncbi:NAD(P)-dependent oxidoreductase [Fodinicola acaciae]|uniref:NAD(P)-dependent oxidoreductase n=1 Tax=Fodinicola acaciae TaxID=2681555 RepID=UPI0013D798B9|nr:NAD(P)-binding domain-containing protein [Fodinicola acaciae]